jgi:hypothetical protein
MQLLDEPVDQEIVQLEPELLTELLTDLGPALKCSKASCELS